MIGNSQKQNMWANRYYNIEKPNFELKYQNKNVYPFTVM